MNPVPDKGFLIAGPPRSGSSLLAGLLQKHGVWTGSSRRPDIGNPTGYFENKQIVGLEKTILKAHGFRARADALVPVQGLSPSEEERQWFRQELMAVLRQRGAGPWLFKDSKILFLYPLFRSVLFDKDVTWILPMRGTDRVLNSLLRHPVWRRRMDKTPHPAEHLIAMIQRQKQIQAQIATEVDSVIQIETDRIISGAESARAFLEECSIPFERGVYESFVRPELWHG